MLDDVKFVTVFGSSIPQEGEEEYKIAYRLGELLARKNISVCSGGFQGVMDGVSKGAKENGAQAIGVTLDIYNAVASKYLTKQIVTHSLFDRLKNLVEIGDAYIVLQGGTGTLLELALVWEYMNKGMIPKKPFAVHSSLWKEITKVMEKQIAKENRKTGLLKSFENIDECAEFIISNLKSGADS
ncbi:MAG: LOG family protein [Ignavibacteriales bacterium]|nr:LOG family protein [Ignavibacteriales bacterium]